MKKLNKKTFILLAFVSAVLCGCNQTTEYWHSFFNSTGDPLSFAFPEFKAQADTIGNNEAQSDSITDFDFPSTRPELYFYIGNLGNLFTANDLEGKNLLYVGKEFYATADEMSKHLHAQYNTIIAAEDIMIFESAEEKMKYDTLNYMNEKKAMRIEPVEPDYDFYCTTDSADTLCEMTDNAVADTSNNFEKQTVSTQEDTTIEDTPEFVSQNSSRNELPENQICVMNIWGDTMNIDTTKYANASEAAKKIESENSIMTTDSRPVSIKDFFEDANKNKKTHITLTKIKDETTGKEYDFPKLFCTTHIGNTQRLDSCLGLQPKVLASENGQPIAICYDFGDRKMTFISAPILFTNYGSSFELSKVDKEYYKKVFKDRKNAKRTISFSLLNSILGNSGFHRHYTGKPNRIGPTAIVLQPYDSDASKGHGYETTVLSPVKDGTQNSQFVDPIFKSLAKDFISLLVIMFVIPFAFKRKQHIIPTIDGHRNRTKEFIIQESELYDSRKEYNDLTKKMYNLFCNQIKDRLRCDLNDKKQFQNNILTLSKASKIEFNVISSFLSLMNDIKSGRKSIENKDEMAKAIDMMDKISNELKLN